MSVGELMFLMQFEPIKELLRMMSYLFVGMVVLAIFTYCIASRAFRYAKLVSKIIGEGEKRSNENI